MPHSRKQQLLKSNRATSYKLAMAEGSPSSKVKFVEDNSEKPNFVKHVPTQKYNRKEIQKRLEIESWMDERLKELFETDVCMCVHACVRHTVRCGNPEIGKISS